MLAAILYDNVSEGKDVILGMLIVGLTFVGVIALGQLGHWLNGRRKERRRMRRATY